LHSGQTLNRLSASLRKMVALHWGQRIHNPSGTPRFCRDTIAIFRDPCLGEWSFAEYWVVDLVFNGQRT